MIDWIGQNGGAVQAAAAVLTALVWLIYLHILVSGLRRSRRSEILITLAGRRDRSGRILISNLGFEPIYVLDVLLRGVTNEDERIVSVAELTDREGTSPDSLKAATLQTPLKSGEVMDAGQIEDLIGRAARHQSLDTCRDSPRGLEITVAAVTAATSNIVAARREFHVQEAENGEITVRPVRLYAEQVRRRGQRKKIERLLVEAL